VGHLVYFGGTFDPVHRGHLAMAAAALTVPGVEGVVFLPALTPPHKRARPIRPFAERVHLLRLACTDHPALSVATLEGDLPAPSFTARTLAALMEGGEQTPISLLIGADTLLDLPNWWRPEEVVRHASFLVAPRPEVPIDRVRAALSGLLPGERFAERVRFLAMAPVECSSTKIRADLARGLDPGDDLPEPVRAYLQGDAGGGPPST
jgi:nicotinate-nucleotide adenylyltransferase